MNIFKCFLFKECRRNDIIPDYLTSHGLVSTCIEYQDCITSGKLKIMLEGCVYEITQAWFDGGLFL